jgi:hypothetical protein
MKMLFVIFLCWAFFTAGRGYDTEHPAQVSLALASEQVQSIVTKGQAMLSEASK